MIGNAHHKISELKVISTYWLLSYSYIATCHSLYFQINFQKHGHFFVFLEAFRFYFMYYGLCTD